MPDTWPSDIIPYAYSFYLQHNTLSQESPFTRKRRRVQLQGQRYICDMQLKAENRVKAQRIDGLLDRLQGSFNTVLLFDPDHVEPLGTNLDASSVAVTFFTDGTTFTDGTGFSGGSSGITVYGGWSIGSTSVLATGFPASTTQLKEGDNVGLNGRLYRLTADVTADVFGRAYLALNRPLLAALTHGMAVVRSRPTSPFTLSDDDQPVRQRQAGDIYHYSLRFVEAL